MLREKSLYFLRYLCETQVVNLKARAITSGESFWRSESPASRFHSKKRLAFYPSISRSKIEGMREWGKDAGDEEENVKKYRQETVDFRIFQQNGFGFPLVISLANYQRYFASKVALSSRGPLL